MKKPIRFINTLIAKGKVRDAEFWSALKTDTRFKYIVSASIAFVSASAITSVHLFRNLMPQHSPLLPTLLGTLLAGIIAILVLYGLVYPQLRKLSKTKKC